MGCECDAGYSGPDCSLRTCKYGVDPLYLDDASTVKYPIYDFAVLTNKLNVVSTDAELFTDGQKQSEKGHWAIRYYDNAGEDWLTGPIEAGAACTEVVEALEALPNHVIESGTIHCTKSTFFNRKQENSTNQFVDSDYPLAPHQYHLAYKMALWESYTGNDQGELSIETPIKLYIGSNDTSSSTKTVSGHIYRMKFFGNPGAQKEPEIELYLDGARPSLISPNSKVITKVWTDGQQGEDVDHFADHCDGVTVTIGTDQASYNYLTGFTIAERNLLKKCLGESDFDSSNNQDVYNWDKGSKLYPHIIKLVRTVTTYTDGGYYAVIWYDTSVQKDNLQLEGTFKLMNPITPPDMLLTDQFDVYTTTGTLALTSNKSEATFGFASKYIYMTNITYDNGYTNQTYDGDISCEVGNNNAHKFDSIFHCLNKTDLFTMINWEYPNYNPPHLNLYTAERLHTGPYTHSVKDRFNSPKHPNGEMHFMTHMITSDISTNWGVVVNNNPAGGNGKITTPGTPQFHVYKFFPATASDYTYVAPCSNRGICDTDSGTCKCFAGYTSDSCHEQNSLSV